MTQLFRNSHEALVFAFNYTSQQYAETPMSKLMKRSGNMGSGKGLVGLDGAGQVGFIKKTVERMDPLYQACVVAKYSLKFGHCNCCGSSDKILEEYQVALIRLREWALSELTGISHTHMRQAIIRCFYEPDFKLGKFADKMGIPRRTATHQRGVVWPKLKKLDMMAQGTIASELHELCLADV